MSREQLEEAINLGVNALAVEIGGNHKLAACILFARSCADIFADTKPFEQAISHLHATDFYSEFWCDMEKLVDEYMNEAIDDGKAFVETLEADAANLQQQIAILSQQKV